MTPQSARDPAIGTLVDGLKQRELFDNALILFISVNGGCAESGPNGRSNGDPTQSNSNWFCGTSWACMQETPFRKYKHDQHEGGIATPIWNAWADRANVAKNGLPKRRANNGDAKHQKAAKASGR